MGKAYPLTENIINHVTKITHQEFKKINWHNAELYVRPLLSFEEYANAVRAIVGYCFSSEGAFAPEFLDFALRVNIISTYAYVELPDDFDRLYELVYLSDLYDTVCSAVNKAQLDALKQAVMICIKLQ